MNNKNKEILLNKLTKIAVEEFHLDKNVAKKHLEKFYSNKKNDIFFPNSEEIKYGYKDDLIPYAIEVLQYGNLITEEQAMNAIIG